MRRFPGLREIGRSVAIVIGVPALAAAVIYFPTEWRRLNESLDESTKRLQQATQDLQKSKTKLDEGRNLPRLQRRYRDLVDLTRPRSQDPAELREARIRFSGMRSAMIWRNVAIGEQSSLVFYMDEDQSSPSPEAKEKIQMYKDRISSLFKENDQPSPGRAPAPTFQPAPAPNSRAAPSWITIVAGTYGKNCGAPYGNKTAHLESQCNGLKSCTYVIDYQVIGDPARGCKKNYVAEWKCADNKSVQSATAGAEAGHRSTLLLTCR